MVILKTYKRYHIFNVNSNQNLQYYFNVFNVAGLIDKELSNF